MRKILLILLSFLFIFSLSGCSKKVTIEIYENQLIHVFHELNTESSSASEDKTYKEVYVFSEIDNYEEYFNVHFIGNNPSDLLHDIDFNKYDLLIINSKWKNSNNGRSNVIKSIIKKGSKVTITLIEGGECGTSDENAEGIFDISIYVPIDKNLITNENDFIVNKIKNSLDN